MALKSVPIKPVEAYRLDDPRRPSGETASSAQIVAPVAGSDPISPPAPLTPPARRRQRAPVERHLSLEASAAKPDSAPRDEPELLGNPYARGGRPHQVAVSLYVPQWERIEEQCAELRGQGIRDATITRWLFAVLHFRAPSDGEAAAQLLRRWQRLEADEEGPYFGLRKEARGVRFFEALWERQRATVTDLRHASGLARPTLATWTTALVELDGPKTATEARELMRQLRFLLAGDPP